MNTVTKPIQYVNHRGDPVYVPTITGRGARGQPKFNRAREEWHKGFIVIGHKPGAVEQARLECEQAMREWQRTVAAGEAGKKKPPKAWDEKEWRATAMLHRVQSRPLEVPSAAEHLKALAEQHGWTEVRVEAWERRKK